MRKLFLIFLLPGVVFQSIIIAGGYGTGQELSVFFLSLGPKEGLLGILLVPIPIISVSAILSFELARQLVSHAEPDDAQKITPDHGNYTDGDRLLTGKNRSG